MTSLHTVYIVEKIPNTKLIFALKNFFLLPTQLMFLPAKIYGQKAQKKISCENENLLLCTASQIKQSATQKLLPKSLNVSH